MELFITLTEGMGEPTYGFLLSLIASCIEGSSLDTRWILGACSAAILSRYQRVGRLCRDGADTQYMQYLSKSRITSPLIR